MTDFLSRINRLIDNVFEYILLPREAPPTQSDVQNNQTPFPNPPSQFDRPPITLKGKIENETPHILELTFSEVVESLADIRIKGTASKDLVSHPYSQHITYLFGLGTREIFFQLTYPVAHYDRVFVSVPSLGIVNTRIINLVEDNGAGQPIAPEFYQGGPAAFEGNYGSYENIDYVDDIVPEANLGAQTILNKSEDNKVVVFRVGGNIDSDFPISLDPSYTLRGSNITLAGWIPSLPPSFRQSRFFTVQKHIFLDNIHWHRGLTIPQYLSNKESILKLIKDAGSGTNKIETQHQFSEEELEIQEKKIEEYIKTQLFKDVLSIGTAKRVLDYVVVANSTFSGGLDEVLTIYGDRVLLYRCIIADGLSQKANIEDDRNHAFGSILTSSANEKGMVIVLECLYHNLRDRQPLARVRNLLICNSIISNPQIRGIYLQTNMPGEEDGGFDSYVNIIGNLFLKGANTIEEVNFIYAKPFGEHKLHIYLEDNMLVSQKGFEETPKDQRALVKVDGRANTRNVIFEKSPIPFALPSRFAPMNSKDVLANVLANVGPWKRGTYERNVVKRVLTRFDSIIFDYSGRAQSSKKPDHPSIDQIDFNGFPNNPADIASGETYWRNFDIYRLYQKASYQSD